MGKRTGRPRGAPKGNTNRLKHGRYSRAHLAQRAEVSALIRDSRCLVRRALLFLKLRKALEGKNARVFEARLSGRSIRAGNLKARLRPTRMPRVFGRKPATRAAIRGSPPWRHAITMTNRPGKAMPFAGKFAMASG